MLPFNSFTIHELIGLVVSFALAAAFYLVYAMAGRRRMDLLCANFIACTAGLCLVAFLTDNLVPAGMSSRGWPNGPSAEELAQATLHIQRFAWVFGILMTVAQLHFVLSYADHWNFLRRHISLVYLAAILVMPLVWTPYWLPIRPEPAAETSSWSVTIPWMPQPTPLAGILFTLVWCTSNGYTLFVLYRRRRRTSRQSDPSTYPSLVLVAVFIQVVFGTADLVLGIADYNGISMIPIGAVAMGIILAVVLLRERAEVDRLREQLAREKAVLLQSIHQPLLYFDKGLCLQWANAHAGQLAAGGGEVVAGCRAEAIWKNGGGPEVTLLKQAVTTGESNQCEVASPGRSRWIIYNVPIPDDRHRPLGVLVLAVDVTQIRWAEEVLRDFNSRVLAARDEERRRLAGDLHDSVAQSLAALHMGMTAEVRHPDGDAGPNPVLNRLAAGLKEVVQEVSRVCYDLYPPTLDHFGLPSTLQRVVSQCGTRAECRLHCGGPVATMRFGRDTEIALYRIAQEAVSNAVKHGQVKKIDVYLAYEEGILQLSVVDDGVGFDPADASRHGLGLDTMKGRAHGIGGETVITSRPGQTRVDVRVACRPISPAGADGSRAAATNHQMPDC